MATEFTTMPTEAPPLVVSSDEILFVVGSNSDYISLAATSGGTALDIESDTTGATNHRYVLAPANESIMGIHPNKDMVDQLIVIKLL